MMPTCRLGGVCVLTSRTSVYGDGPAAAGIAQCVRCSEVYEADGWRRRQCGHCGLFWGESLYDPCVGLVAGGSSVCCGHGTAANAYGVI